MFSFKNTLVPAILIVDTTIFAIVNQTVPTYANVNLLIRCLEVNPRLDSGLHLTAFLAYLTEKQE